MQRPKDSLQRSAINSLARMRTELPNLEVPLFVTTEDLRSRDGCLAESQIRREEVPLAGLYR